MTTPEHRPGPRTNGSLANVMQVGLPVNQRMVPNCDYGDTI